MRKLQGWVEQGNTTLSIGGASGVIARKVQGSYPSATVIVYIDSAPTLVILAISRTTNVVTVTVPTGSGFIAGQLVTIAAVTDASFDGTFTILSTSATQFTYAQTAANASSSGGTAYSSLRLANIYADNIGTTKANPFVSAADGTWFFYAANGVYDVKFSGGGITAPFTISGLVLFDESSIWTNVQASPWFAAGDGTTNDTYAIQAAIDSLTATGGTVLFPPTANGYNIDASLTIPASNIKLLGVTGAKLINASNTLVLAAMIEADFDGVTQAENIQVENLILVGGSSTTNCFKRGVTYHNVTRSRVHNCIISGVDQPFASGAGLGDAYGVYFHDLVTFSEITNNKISFAVAGANTDVGFRIGVLLQSPMVDAFNGQVSGSSPLAQTVTDISISNNTVYLGTHAYEFQNSARVVISNNMARGQIRGVLGFVTNKDLTITGNTLNDSSSSNMAFDYNNIGLTITGNTCNGNAGEGSIVLYYENTNVVVSGNVLNGFEVHGIFIAYGGHNINVSGNELYSITASVVGIDVQGAPGAAYTIALFVTPSVDKISVKNNRIHLPTATSYGIRALSKETGSSLDPVNVTDVVVDDNDIVVTGGYGVIFSKNGGTGTFTPTMGDNNTLIVTAGFANGPFGSDYDVYRVERRSAIPANGSWAVGSIIWNTVPTTGGNVGWVCVTAGTPGTWRPFGTPYIGQTYVPAWTQPSGTQPALGDGTLTGIYTKIGSLVTVQITWTAGPSTTYGNNLVSYRFSLPSGLPVGTLATVQYGVAFITDSSAGSTVTTNQVFVGANETAVAIFDMLGGVVRQLSPITFANGDSIVILITYEVT